jgi:hypothetical protein
VRLKSLSALGILEAVPGAQLTVAVLNTVGDCSWRRVTYYSVYAMD